MSAGTYIDVPALPSVWHKADIFQEVRLFNSYFCCQVGGTHYVDTGIKTDGE